MEENNTLNLVIQWYNQEKLCLIDALTDDKMSSNYQIYTDLIKRIGVIDAILKDLVS